MNIILVNNLISNMKVNKIFAFFNIAHICQIDSFAKIIKIISLLINIIRIAVPIILIIATMLKLLSAVSGGADAFEKVKKVIITNVIAAVLIFLIPTFVNIITRLTGTYDTYQVCLKSSENPITPKPIVPKDDEEETVDKTAPKITAINHKAAYVTVSAETGSTGAPIAGYYFTTSSNKPTGYEFEWVLKSTNYLEIAKLPGNYYVYVKDANNKISSASNLTITWEELYNDGPKSRDDKNYPPIVGKIDTVLKTKNDSLASLNDFIAWSVRSAGLFTKEGVATAGISAQNYLHAKHNIHISYISNVYCFGQRYNVVFGADPDWGEVITMGHIDRSKRDIATSKGIKGYCLGLYGGQDCQSFFGWSVHNGGFLATNTHGGYVGQGKGTEESCGRNCNKDKMFAIYNSLVLADELINSDHVMMFLAHYDDNHDGQNDGVYIFEAYTRVGIRKWSYDELYSSNYFTVNHMGGYYENSSNYACLQDYKGDLVSIPTAWRDKSNLFRSNCKATN